ncbi:hypothetical protein KAM368_32200 [Aeromonas caviae]|nr:hypothetical protein KAM356_32130 [Aeromonas caviae]GJB08584.1 hypothetical protein KAM361_32570 [Aeromonas caviae]GJB17240.1 hypothetical protein KAM363_32450 [Aeromonas caviae]GJB38653.1 hypothetical protein KAM368_32200 [Aeromonas caviae]
MTRDSLVMALPMVNPCDCIPAVPRGEKAPGPAQRNMLPGSGVVAPQMRVVSLEPMAPEWVTFLTEP